MNGEDDSQQLPYHMGEPPNIQDRLDQISLFLQYTEHIDPMRTIVDKVKSIGYIEESHMLGHIEMDGAIMTFFKRGQIQKGFEFSNSQNSEFRMTMSILGKFIENVSKQEFRYSYTQQVIPSPEVPQKKGFFRRR